MKESLRELFDFVVLCAIIGGLLFWLADIPLYPEPKLHTVTVPAGDWDNGYPFVITKQERNLISIKLHDSLVEGSDGACYEAAKVINSLCEQGFTVWVDNDWVPSKKNPIDLAWSRVLVGTTDQEGGY